LKVGDCLTGLFAINSKRLRNSNIDFYVTYGAKPNLDTLKSFSSAAFQHATSYEMPNRLSLIHI